jgi:hypothetical protein
MITVGDLAFAVRARPLANLAHHLDCLASTIRGSCEAIRAFWTPTWNKADDEALAQWRAVGVKYDISGTFGGPKPASPAPLPHSELDFKHSLRIAALLSSSVDDYKGHLGALLAPQDIEKRVAAAAHFQPRFERWWKSEAADIAAQYRADVESLLGHGELGAIIARAARFYAAPLPRGTTIDLDLIVLPSSSKLTGAEQIGSHSIVEVVPKEKPALRMGVVCHELFHFFYNSRTPEQQAALMAQFEASHDAHSAIAYFLLDEAVATALGNGVVARAMVPDDYEKRSKRERGFYSNHAIDATAKGLLSRSKDGDPTLGPPLDDPATALALLAAAGDAVGDPPRPIEYLHSFAAASDDGWWDAAMQETIAASSSNNIYNSSPFDSSDATSMVADHPLLSAVTLVPRKRIAALAAYKDALPPKVRAEIEREAKRPGPFAYVAQRSPRALMFVIVADDPESAKSVATPLFQSAKAVSGVFRPPR